MALLLLGQEGIQIAAAASHPRIAVVLRGIAAATYTHYSGRIITIDWRETAAGMREHLIAALDADVFFHAWREDTEEYLDTQEHLMSFFKPIAAEVEPLRRWDWRFDWLLDEDNMRSNFSREISAAEWHDRKFLTDIVKYD